MELITEIPADRLLNNIDISKDKSQLARARVTGLNCKCMKKQLKSICNNKSKENSISSVNVEPVLETKGYNWTSKKTDGYY